VESDAVRLPAISTARLDPSAARVIEGHLSAVGAAPKSGAAWGKLGAALKSFEYDAEARRCLEAAERLEPKEPRWPYLHGALLVVDAPSAAIAKWRRAVSLCGSEPDAPRLRLAKLLAETGQPEDSRRELETLLRDQPGHAPASLALAHLAHARGATTEAIALAGHGTNDHRTARAAWTLLATLHLRAGDTNAARTASARAAALPPDAPVADPFEDEALALRSDPRDLSDRAQRLLMSGQLPQAAPLVDQLVREQPGFAEGWLLLGRLQNLRQEFARAEASLRRHLELDAQSVNGLFQLGMSLLGQNRHAEAAPVFERAIQLKSDFGPAFFNLGLALARAGRKREAVPAFRAAIRHNPERIDSYLLLADLHLQLGEPDQAADPARQAAALNPSDPRLAALREKISRAGQ
jgi:tetratricopeptide (TPR) repeat protein